MNLSGSLTSFWPRSSLLSSTTDVEVWLDVARDPIAAAAAPLPISVTTCSFFVLSSIYTSAPSGTPSTLCLNFLKTGSVLVTVVLALESLFEVAAEQERSVLGDLGKISCNWGWATQLYCSSVSGPQTIVH